MKKLQMLRVVSRHHAQGDACVRRSAPDLFYGMKDLRIVEKGLGTKRLIRWNQMRCSGRLGLPLADLSRDGSMRTIISRNICKYGMMRHKRRETAEQGES